MIASRLPDSEDVKRLNRSLKGVNEPTLKEVLDDIRWGTRVMLKTAHSTLTLSLTDESVHVGQMGGRLEDIPELVEAVAKIAAEQNRPAVTLEGRKGWKRVLYEYGFRPDGKRLRLEL